MDDKDRRKSERGKSQVELPEVLSQALVPSAGKAIEVVKSPDGSITYEQFKALFEQGGYTLEQTVTLQPSTGLEAVFVREGEARPMVDLTTGEVRSHQRTWIVQPSEKVTLRLNGAAQLDLFFSGLRKGDGFMVFREDRQVKTRSGKMVNQYMCATKRLAFEDVIDVEPTPGDET